MTILSSRITPAEREEALRFMRPFAASVEAAKQFRSEGEAPNPNPNPPADPFAGVDMDLLDDATRQAITTAKASLQSLQNQIAQGGSATDQVRQLQQQLEQANQLIARGQQQQQQQDDPTVEEQLAQYYLQAGVTNDPKQAANFARINAGAFKIFGQKFGSELQQGLQPVVSTVLGGNAKDAFVQAQQQDSLGVLKIPEVAQVVWDKLDKAAEEGKVVSVELALNYARIYGMKHFEEHGIPNTPTEVIQQQQQQQPRIQIPGQINQLQQQQQNTRFSYPGAGLHVVKSNSKSSTREMLDPETQAAIDAVKGEWEAAGLIKKKA